MSEFRNRYWSFNIEQKVFVIHLTRDGGGIRISERTRVRSYDLEIDVAAAVWCLETVKEVLRDGVSKIFCRKYRASNMVLLADIFTNNKGVFLKFTKLSNGTLKNIIIPAGRFKRGWRRMMVCLDNLVGKRFWTNKGRSVQGGHISEKPFYRGRTRQQEESYNWNQTQRSWREVVGGMPRDHQDRIVKRNWRAAVLVFRFTSSVSWCSIKEGLSSLLNAHHELTPLAADRAILWFANENDRIRTKLLGRVIIPGVGEVKLERWNPESQLKDPKIVCSNSWMGIEGLPLNLWNKHVFKVIGSKCGGLLDIATCTEDLTFLNQALLKLKGKKGGFLQERLEIFCWGKRLSIKLVPSNFGVSGFHGDCQELGRKPMVEQGIDVAPCTQTIDLSEEKSGKHLSAKSVSQRKEVSVGEMGAEQVGCVPQVKFGPHGKSHKSNRLDFPLVTGSGSRASASSSERLLLKNSFDILNPHNTCSNKFILPGTQPDVGQAQNFQEENMPSTSGLGHKDALMEKGAGSRKSGLGHNELVEKETGPLFPGMGQCVFLMEQGAGSFSSGQSKSVLQKPTSSSNLGQHPNRMCQDDSKGTECYNLGKAKRSIQGSISSTPYFTKPFSQSGSAVKAKTLSPGSAFSKAVSDSVLETKKRWMKGNFKKLKPKQKSDFLKGCIFSWEDFTKSEGKLNFKKDTASVLRPIEQDKDREEVREETVLKVYARNGAKRSYTNNLDSELNHVRMEDVYEGLESDFEGNRQLNFRPACTSTTSFSDSDETFITDSATEEEFDLRLQGISSLMDDYEPTVNKDRHDSMHYVKPMVHPSSEVLPQLDIEGEVEKANTPIVDADGTRNLSVPKVERIGEWKNLQPLITDLGLQLIPVPKDFILPKNRFKPRRKRGTRELKNLEFKVNYDRSDCSKGKSPFL